MEKSIVAEHAWEHCILITATRDFQSSISEALFHRCHLDVQGLLHQQLLSSVMVQYGGLLPVDRVVGREEQPSPTFDLQ